MKKPSQIGYITKFIFLIIFLLSTKVFAQDNPTDVLFKHKLKLWENFKEVSSNHSSTQNQVDALYYNLELEISFDPDLLIGKVTNRYKSKTNNLNFLEIDFDNSLVISNISGPVTDYFHTNKKISINLSQSFNQDEIIEVTIEYSGKPDAGNDRWFVFGTLANGDDHVWTLSEPYGAKYWWPCKDSPADKADSVDISVTVPENQIVASNGTLISNNLAGFGKRRFHWKESYPIATYLVSLAIAPYAHFTDMYTTVDDREMLLDYYVYPENEELAREIFPVVIDHLDGLSSYFGPYPFLNEKYGMAQFQWGGAMEHQTITSITHVGENWNYLYVHELGHQWFGDALTCATWQDIWLNEGFASYSEALYAEWAGYNGHPPGEAAYHNYMQSQKYLEGGIIHIEDTTEVRNIFSRIVYDKGSWVLHMLRKVMGDDDFFTSIYNYANGDLIYSSVKTENFRNVCEQVSGKSLDTFFDQWLNYEYYPVYSYSWEKRINNLNSVDVTIIQDQNSIVYEMPIDLNFMFSSGQDTLITIINDRKEQHYSFDFNNIVVAIEIDPQNWILKRVKDMALDTYSSDIIIESIYPNPTKNNSTIIVKYWGTESLSLHIYDINGRFVTTLIPYYQSSRHEYYFKWDGKSTRREEISSGIYFLKPVNRIQNGKAEKIIILK